MAAVSPVVVNSSSPAPSRLPTITPPSFERRDTDSSSPSAELPSLSTFIRPRAAKLQTGSRAQAVPAGAGFGFQSAGSFWREKQLEDGGGQEKPERETFVAARRNSAESSKIIDAPVEKSVGKDAAAARTKKQQGAASKLKKPTKPLRATSRGSENVLVAADTFEFTEPCEEPAKPRQPGAVTLAVKPPSRARKPSVDLQEYAFGVYDLGMKTQVPAAAAKSKVKKPPRTKENDIRTGLAVAKPRKRTAKPDTTDVGPADSAVEGGGKTETAKTKRQAVRKQSKDPATEAKATKPRKTKASKDSESQAASHETETNVGGKSTYFPTAPPPAANTTLETNLAPNQSPDINPEESMDADLHNTVQVVPQRRRDWTPVKDTAIVSGAGRRESVTSAAESRTQSPKQQLTDILGSFSYVDNTNQMQSDRLSTGEAMTKRRRVELGETVAAGSTSSKAVTVIAAREPKQKKPAGRKKPQTITALATAAYQPVQDVDMDQSSVSEFFAPRKDDTIAPKAVDVATAKPKKPRKKPVTVNDNPAVSSKVKPPRKSRAKVKPKEVDLRAKLYSPVRATAQLKQQEFLFGTSSQLAVDESPAFIKDMQAAVKASEQETVAHQDSTYEAGFTTTQMPSQLPASPSRSKSCTKVPSAPHGTNLSVGQADRDLWSCASRDRNGGFLRDFALRDRPAGSNAAMAVEATSNIAAAKSPFENRAAFLTDVHEPYVTLDDNAADLRALPAREVPYDNSATAPEQESNTRVIIDLSGTSPARAEESPVVFVEPDLPAREVERQEPESPTTSLQHVNDATAEDDTWMLIQSESPAPSIHAQRPVIGVRKVRSPSPGSQGNLSPLRQRTVLQSLDVNASLMAPEILKSGQATQSRAVSSITTDAVPKRPRGRPRKQVVDTEAPPATKKRGRPPKQPVVASDPSPQIAKFKKPRTLEASTSQQIPPPSEWLDIDEIDNSDSPVTPSPPRRRATSPPPNIPALQLAVEPSPLIEPKETAPAAAVSAPSVKVGETQWPTIRAAIFPRLTTTIKNAPKSSDPQQLTWYEKILMYDPITLEDLTAWLNEQGLRIEVHKQKAKPKKKGRKKKDAETSELSKDDAVEWEVVQEQLQAWMVQKWCEENSICCVWAGGGWSGRARH